MIIQTLDEDEAVMLILMAEEHFEIEKIDVQIVKNNDCISNRVKRKYGIQISQADILDEELYFDLVGFFKKNRMSDFEIEFAEELNGLEIPDISDEDIENEDIQDEPDENDDDEDDEDKPKRKSKHKSYDDVEMVDIDSIEDIEE